MPGSGASTRAGELRAAHDEEEIMRIMTRRAGIAALLFTAVAVGFALPPAAAAEEEEEEAYAEEAEAEAYAEEELDDCLDCHDEDADFPVLPILATPHAVKADKRTPLAQQYECQTCHGPVEEMARVEQWASLTMGWCVNCHRDNAPEDVLAEGDATRRSNRLTDCGTCHH